MVAELERGAALVVGCRYMPGRGTAGWTRLRRLQSLSATRLAQAGLGTPLRDPMSGYFAMWKSDFMAIRQRVDGSGFKILLEIAAHLPPALVRGSALLLSPAPAWPVQAVRPHRPALPRATVAAPQHQRRGHALR